MENRLKLIDVNDGEEHILSPPSVLIGRDPSCDIVITRGLPSRHHARFSFRDDQWLVEDLNSTNGTFVNNRRIARPTPVSAGDTVRFGMHDFRLFEFQQGDLTISAEQLAADEEASIFLGERPAARRRKPVRRRDKSHEHYSLPRAWSGARGADTRYSEAARDELLEEIFAQTAEPPEAVLILYRGKRRAPVVYGVTPGAGTSSWTMGRDRECDLPVNDPTVSRLHAVLVHEDGRWLLVDSDSTNGIRVDDVLESELELEDETSAELGRVEVIFRLME